MAPSGWVEAGPRLVHLTEASAWASIERYGLRPAAWFIERAAGITAEEKQRLLTSRRAKSAYVLVHGLRVRLRDQQPLAAAWHEQLLEGEDPARYLAELNRFVFLFPVGRDLRGSGLDGFRRKYTGDRLLLEFDTVALVERLSLYGGVKFVGGNPGATSFDPKRKHLSAANWLSPAGWSDKHPKGRVPREIMVRDGLAPDMLDDLLLQRHEL